MIEMFMLQVSDSAVTVLNQERAARQVPETFGVRVYSQAGDDGQAMLAVGFAEEPAQGDAVREQGGTEFYVASELVGPLSDHILDVEDTPDGPQLALLPQPRSEDSSAAE